MHLPAPARAVWSRSDKFIVFILAIALVYVLLRLSPSSYAFGFRVLGLTHRNGLIFGEARSIRSDEWAVWTPYFQAAVNNHFGRFNLTSIYQEDLRNFNALPLWDWGLAFKPELWGFFVFEPARAFSLYHASIMAAFVIGWYGLFAKLGFDRKLSALASLAFFYTSAVQGWWTTIGPVVAFFPFLPWIFLSAMHPIAKAALTAWVMAVWLIAHLYPPLIISIGFAGAALVLALQPKSALRPWHVAASVLGAAIGAGITLVYLRDPITVMAQTVFPGQRVNGGGNMYWEHWLGQLLPQFSIAGETSYLPLNYLEATTAATFLPLFALCFVSLDGLKRLRSAPECAGDRRALLVLGGALVLISLWQLLPLPHWVGAPLLWDRAPAYRFIFASGALLTAMALVILRAAPPRLTATHFALAAGAVLASWVISMVLMAQGRLDHATQDAYPLIPLAVLFFLRRKAAGQEAHAIAATALAAGVLAFGFFNPFQSAWPIFHRPVSPVIEEARRAAQTNSHHWVVQEHGEGALFNGYGLPSVGHVLIRPQLTFFRQYFPDLPEEEFNRIFNRYAHVHVRNIPAPTLFQDDVIELPPDRFR